MTIKRVYVLYEETGQYSDYGMGILGVFSSPAAARPFLEAHHAERIAEYKRLGGWRLEEEFGELSWADDGQPVVSGRTAYDALSYCIDGREIDPAFVPEVRR